MNEMLKAIWPLILLMIGLVIVGVLVRLPRFLRQLKGTERATDGWGPAEFRYSRVDSLLTPGERAFYSVLVDAVDGRFEIMVKVRLADLLEVAEGGPAHRSALNRVMSKHVDMVLCEVGTLRPVLAIELDDRTHLQTSRRERDAVVDNAMKSAGMPLLREPARSRYSVDAVRRSVKSALGL